MSLQLLFRGFVIRELPIPCGVRPEGSHAKRRRIPDGVRVLLKILGILKAYKPLTSFGRLALMVLVEGLLIGAFPTIEHIEYRCVFSDKAILAASLGAAQLCRRLGRDDLHALNFRILEMTNVLSNQAC